MPVCIFFFQWRSFFCQCNCWQNCKYCNSVAWGSKHFTVFSQDGFVMVHFTRQLRTVHFTGLLPVAIYLVSRDVARLCEAKFNSMLLLLPLLLGLRWHHLILQQRFWLLFSKEDKGWTFLHCFAALLHDQQRWGTSFWPLNFSQSALCWASISWDGRE